MGRSKTRLTGEERDILNELLLLALEKIGVLGDLNSVQRSEIMNLQREVNQYLSEKNLLSDGRFQKEVTYATSRRALYEYYLDLKNEKAEIPFSDKVLNSVVHYATRGSQKFWSEFKNRGKKTKFRLQGLSAAIREKYLSDEEFNSIRIIGENYHEIGRLSMSDYYVHLSSLSNENLRNRDTLLNQEKDYSINKIRQRVSDTSTSYISDKILHSTTSIVMGNPGIGKSTFAKWLCFNLAADKEVGDEEIPIYIELRSVDFDKEDFLSEYVLESLLPKHNNQGPSEMFTDSILQSKLILDGFDEIEYGKKQLLLKQIKGLNYVILSRPYGLIDVKMPYPESFVQIDGFNSTCIRQYIDNFLKGYGSEDNSLDEIERLISSNKVLDEYAHVPLMLSYMLLIYVTSETVEKELDSIESMYELQERVFDWILDSATDKEQSKFKNRQSRIEKEETAFEFSNELRQEVEAFSYQMTLSKKFTYEGSFDDPYFRVAETMSALGLGSVKRKKYRWKFSFSTITLQEFLAVRNVNVSSLNSKAFMYLIADNFFWNLCLLLVGRLSKEDSLSKVEELMGSLYQSYLEQEHNYYLHTYFMLLGECNARYCNKEIDEERMSLIFKVFENSYYDHYWRETYDKAISKVFHKTPSSNMPFLDELEKRIDQTADLDAWMDSEILDEGDHFYLNEIINIGIAFEQERIFIVVLSALNRLQQDINQLNFELDELDEIEESTSEAYVETKLMRAIRLRAFYRSILKEFSRETLEKYPQELSDFARHTDIESTNDLKLLVESLRIDPSVFSEDYFDLPFIKGLTVNSLSDPETQLKALVNLEQFMEELFYVVRKKNHITQEEFNTLLFLIEWIDKHALQFDGEELLAYLFDVVILNLSRIDVPEAFDLLFAFVVRHNIEDNAVILDEEQFQEYMRKVFFEVQNGDNDHEFDKKIYAIFTVCEYNFVSAFYTFREPIVKVLLHYIKELGSDTYTSAELQLKRDILIRITSIPYRDYDKKFFIDQIIGSEAQESLPEFVLNTLVMEVLFNRFSFYEKKYWTFLETVYTSNPLTHPVFFLFAKYGELYRYKSNQVHLLRIFNDLFSQVQGIEEVVEKIKAHEASVIDNVNEIMSFVTTLFNLSSCLLFTGKNLREETLRTLQRIISHKLFEEVFEEIDDATIVDYCMIHVLFYYFKRDNENFLHKVDIIEKLTFEAGAKVAFFDQVLDFAEKIDDQSVEQIVEIFKPVFSADLYAEFNVLIKQRSIKTESFSTSQFELLLSKAD